jgi:hypothetical protein
MQHVAGGHHGVFQYQYRDQYLSIAGHSLTSFFVLCCLSDSSLGVQTLCEERLCNTTDINNAVAHLVLGDMYQVSTRLSLA